MKQMLDNQKLKDNSGLMQWMEVHQRNLLPPDSAKLVLYQKLMIKF